MMVSFFFITLSLLGILYVIRLIKHKFHEEEGIIKIIHIIMFSILFMPLISFIVISIVINTIESILIISIYAVLYLLYNGWKSVKKQAD